ncbi:flavin-containing monooxygenase [Dermabacteraceae bacterium P13095]
MHEAVTASSQKVLVIGAGPAGLAAAASLKAAGVAFSVVDFASEVGGAYVRDALWPDLATVTSRHGNQFEEMVTPASFPAFPTREQMAAYLRAYVAKHDLADDIRLGVGVRKATAFSDQRWQVELSNGEIGTYRGLVVATGACASPLLPAWAEDAGTRVIHSDEYRGEDLFEKKVLVVGAGQAAADVATRVADSADETRLSMRSGHWVVPRHIGGLPGDMAASARPSLLGKLNDRIGNRVVARLHGDPREVGMPAPTAPVTRDRVIVSDTLLQDVETGRIGVAADVRELSADGTVRFVDGTSWEPDLIICATGYRSDLSFLASADGSKLTDLSSLAWGTFPRDRDDLVFLGQFSLVGGTIPVLAQQADLAAYHFRALFNDSPAATVFRQMRQDNRHAGPGMQGQLDSLRVPQRERAELLTQLSTARRLFES